MLNKLLFKLFLFFKRHPKIIKHLALVFVGGVLLALVGGKIYQHLDRDKDRGAIAMAESAFDESYPVPVYVEQGWSKADSLWFYNTTQGSGLLPYDFFLVLEEAGSEELLRSPANMDGFRYLPQKKTFFNPDAMPVGFTKDSYQGNNYIGFTCAACHTTQINYTDEHDVKTATRIDGGPAMANMVGFLGALQQALEAAKEGEKGARFVRNVLALNNDYDNKSEVEADLAKWSRQLELYNVVNTTGVEYGYARLDAFGRIFNRVLAHIINREQIDEVLETIPKPRDEGAGSGNVSSEASSASASLTDGDSGGLIGASVASEDISESGSGDVSDKFLLTPEQIEKVLEDVGKTIIREEDLALIIDRLMSHKEGYPGLTYEQLMPVKEAFFNEPNAPVSYPFLWDIVQSDYVQWNGLASNAGLGPLGRNAGEVIGVFAILDWTEKEPGFSLSAMLSGQDNKQKRVAFDSSVDLINLMRLENTLRRLKSPQWPVYFDQPDEELVRGGKLIYEEYCQSCHQVIDRDNWRRRVVSKMTSVESVGTDAAMATNSVTYRGKSGNFKQTYQKRDVGTVIVEETAPVAEILTSAVTGVVATPDPDKNPIRRIADWVYTLAMSLGKNPLKASVKSGDYQPDTTANPFSSLLSYKARPLNGIWATAPYLHNGSVPTLYDLLLPVKKANDETITCDDRSREYRPTTFRVGLREYDAKRVGFYCGGDKGWEFDTTIDGNLNSGHEYGTANDPRSNGPDPMPVLTPSQRLALLEYLKTL